MKSLRSRLLSGLFSKRGAVAAAALLLVLFLFRPGVSHLRNRIGRSIGSALGRRVAINNVRLRVLPRPGFDLEGLVIYDDPAFSAEPMIRAQEVSAAIRLRSLLRGRLEIANLSATEPSINLVRNNQGLWNLASLLERNAQIPAAPTAKPASEHRPAFPYLEAVHARINFKIGETKKSYALMDADVALWQDSENSWGARIKADPVRTDFNLTDTGLVQINATWQRAPSLRLTPLQLSLQWQNGQLGQITTLLSGKDRGWRGGVNLTANLSGTPEALRIESRATIDDFRRYDIVDTASVRLAIGCSGQYDEDTSTLADLLCESPVGGGTLRLRGASTFTEPQPSYDLKFEAEKVPLTSVVRLLRQAKKQVPGDLAASGLLNAEFRAMRSAASSEHAPGGLPENWSGSGSATSVRLTSNAADGKNELAFATIPLALAADGLQRHDTGLREKNGKERESTETHLRIGPVGLTMNGSEPVNARGWVSASGYRFFLRGDVELKDLFRLEDMIALPGTRPAAEGSAKLDVSVLGQWQGFAAPAIVGTARLLNVRAEMHGLNTPIEIGSATLSLTPDAVLLQKISARTGGTHWNGEVTAPRHCGVPNPASNLAPSMGSNIVASLGFFPSCTFHFDLTADQLSTGDLAEWFAPHPAKRPWYRILSANEPQGRSPLLAIEAQGNLHVSRFGFKKVVVSQLGSQVDIQRGKIALDALRGRLLEGRHLGRWTIDASRQPVLYQGSGVLHDISLAQVGALMNDAWIAGTADGSFELDGLLGDSLRGLLARSDGKLQFAMRDGSLTHIDIPGSPVPLPVHRFSGELRLKQGLWDLYDGRLESRDGFYQVSGSASPSGVFDFRLTRGDDQSWALTGTLAEPHVEPTSRTVAKRVDANVNTKGVKQ